MEELLMKTKAYITFIVVCISLLTWNKGFAIPTVDPEKESAFREEYLNQPGVQVLPSGIAYKVIKEGDGPIPQGNDGFIIHMTQKLIDGTVLITITSDEYTWLPGLRPNEREAVERMKAGSTWELLIPPELVYKGDGLENASVIETIELTTVKSK
jgi:FKBP-type peptidyl-prolyl cis-trans isomerase FklB